METDLQERIYKRQSSAGGSEHLPWTSQRDAVDVEVSKSNQNAE